MSSDDSHEVPRHRGIGKPSVWAVEDAALPPVAFNVHAVSTSHCFITLHINGSQSQILHAGGEERCLTQTESFILKDRTVTPSTYLSVLIV